MAASNGSFVAYRYPSGGKEIGLLLWKSTVTVPAGQTSVSVEPTNPVAGSVAAVWIDPVTLTAGATIRGYCQSDGLSTPSYFLNYTVPNPAVETRRAATSRTLVAGKLQVDVGSATAGDSFVLYVWVDPDTPVAVAAYDTATIATQTNDGVAWTSVTIPAGTKQVVIRPQDPTLSLKAATSSAPGTVYEVTPAGQALVWDSAVPLWVQLSASGTFSVRAYS